MYLITQLRISVSDVYNISEYATVNGILCTKIGTNGDEIGVFAEGNEAVELRWGFELEGSRAGWRTQTKCLRLKPDINTLRSERYGP